jgi:hypothetical protein
VCCAVGAVGGLTLVGFAVYALAHGGRLGEVSALDACLALLVLFCVHEAIHALVLHALGHDYRFDVDLRAGGSLSVTPVGDALPRDHLVVATGAPAFTLSVALLAAIPAAGSPGVATLAVVLLWANAMGSSADLVRVGAMLGEPRRTLFSPAVDVDADPDRVH